ncbi:MAG: endonuclease MutS2 [Firmicutes bacterium]|nr:endonuclease MutS2 [Bacillota bacterium]
MTEHDILDWPRVRAEIACLTETDMGRARVDLLHPESEWARVKEEQAHLKEALLWLSRGLPTAQGAQPVRPALERAEKGSALAISEFLAIRQTLNVWTQISAACDREQFPLAATRVAEVGDTQAVREALDRVFDEDGLVKDDASAALREIRHAIRRLEREIEEVFDRILHGGQWSAYLQEHLVTVRFGRRVVPVRHEFRHSVPGIVHDESSSGQTVFVEPLAVVERQNRLTGLRQDEAHEIERILADLTEALRPQAPTLISMHEHLAWLDDHWARARYGLKIGGVFPEVGEERLVLVQARHPLIAQAVPISLEVSQDRPALIISGPNTGGKTATLKTTGLIALMALSGLMVPAAEGTRIPVLDRIMVDIGDQQNLQENLSTFSSHLKRLAPMMEQATERTLCLIDEIGGGTDPEEGALLAQVMIEHLVNRRSLVLATTHYSRLKLLALDDPRVQNAQVEFDPVTLSPTYRLIMGLPGSSYAFDIARRLGFPRELVDRAESLREQGHVDWTEALRAVNRLEEAVRRREEALQVRESELTVREAQLKEWEAQLERRAQEDRVKAQKAWQRELDAMRDAFQQAVQRVKEAEARERAQALEQLREEFRRAVNGPDFLKTPAARGPRPTAPGDRVRVPHLGDIGIVTELAGRLATVQVGNLRLKLALDELERVETGPAPRAPARAASGGTGTLSREKSERLAPEVDLRGMTREEAVAALDKYLDDAVLGGAPFVRIIHGKGTGALRQRVHEFLRQDPRVARFRLGEPGEGGDGATVAFFDERS